MSDHNELIGRQGEPGPGGRQGEAGVAGAEGVAGVRGVAGIEGLPGKRGERGATGRSLSRPQALVMFLIMVFAFVLLALRTEVNTRAIKANSHRIEVTQYNICTERNQTARALIRRVDVEIAAEKRKPKPDPKRIQDLNTFKPAVPDCGPQPVPPT